MTEPHTFDPQAREMAALAQLRAWRLSQPRRPRTPHPVVLARLRAR